MKEALVTGLSKEHGRSVVVISLIIQLCFLEYKNSGETSTNNRYLYSLHYSRPREVQNLGKSEFWEKKSLDNKSLIRRFGV